jgi:putative ATPase
LRNAVTPLMSSAGYGQGSRYVHEDPAAKEMTCLPERLKGKVYLEDDDPLPKT